MRTILTVLSVSIIILVVCLVASKALTKNQLAYDMKCNYVGTALKRCESNEVVCYIAMRSKRDAVQVSMQCKFKRNYL